MAKTEDYTLIGIDCAVQSSNIGIAIGRVVDGVTVVERLYAGNKDPAAIIAAAIARPALLAFDAPLGWPADLGSTLAAHRAGDPIDVGPNTLFRRETDRFVKQAVGAHVQRLLAFHRHARVRTTFQWSSGAPSVSDLAGRKGEPPSRLGTPTPRSYGSRRHRQEPEGIKDAMHSESSP